MTEVILNVGRHVTLKLSIELDIDCQYLIVIELCNHSLTSRTNANWTVVDVELVTTLRCEEMTAVSVARFDLLCDVLGC